jgi:hypothetical protein
MAWPKAKRDVWSDFHLLDWVRRRVNGERVKDIAAACGADPIYVSADTNRVRNADIKESGEDVSGAYW